MIRLTTGMKNGKVQYRKATPKQAAQDFIAGAVQQRVECMDLQELYPEMTMREIALVDSQIQKLEQRVYKMLGFQ